MPQPDVANSLSPADFERFRDLVRASSGFELPEIRRADLARMLDVAAAEARVLGRDALYRFLADPARGAQALRKVVAGLTVGESYFFRDKAQIEAIEAKILPDLIERRSAQRRLRIWSAGCSTGEEPYTLAILLDRMSTRLAGWDVEILATDINPDAIEAARRGVYSAWSFRQTPDAVRDQYFRPAGNRFEILDRLRSRVKFADLNLGSDGPWDARTRGVDLILCRNVLIYLSRPVTERLAVRFSGSLHEGGWLIVGASEWSQAVFHQFVAENLPGTVVYRKPDEGESSAGMPLDARSLTRAHTSPPSPPAFESVSFLVAAPPAEPRMETAPAAGAHSAAEVRAILLAEPLAEGPARLERAWGAGADESFAEWAAAALIDRMNWPLALTWAERAVARGPVSAKAHFLHGLILRETGDPAGAAEDFRRCLFLDPSHVLGHVALATILAGSGQVKRARAARASVLRLLEGRPRDEPLDDADGLTVGRILDLLTAGGP
ncbi:CheR family methyltransferase [Isosphaeraceae bacterium EP7]